MLAYYTSLVKKADLIRKMNGDAEILMTEANDVVCLVKSFSVALNSRDFETAQEAIKKAEELSKVVSAITSNLKTNFDGYLTATLMPEVKTKEENTEDKQSTPTQKNVLAEQQQLATIVEAVKSLKEMKDSLNL